MTVIAVFYLELIEEVGVKARIQLTRCEIDLLSYRPTMSCRQWEAKPNAMRETRALRKVNMPWNRRKKFLLPIQLRMDDRNETQVQHKLVATVTFCALYNFSVFHTSVLRFSL